MRLKLLSAVIFAACLHGTALAGPQFVDKSGVANFGYDVVAYHTAFEPTKGSPEFTAEYNGVPFWFASAENRDTFLADPEAYAPAYDGHCAYAMAHNKKLTVDPEAFTIVNPDTDRPVDRKAYKPGSGQLYINYDPGVNEKFAADSKELIAEADFAWRDCLEHRPAAKPKKGFSDLFPGSRPKSCPAG